MISELSVTSHFTHSILKTVKASSDVINPKIEEWLRLHEVEPRISLDIVNDIWEYCLANTNDELFGLRSGLEIKLGDLDVVGFLLLSCETLEDVIKALVEFYPLIGEDGYYAYIRDGDECQLIYTQFYLECRDQRITAAMASLISLSKALIDGHFVAKAISFKQSALNASDEARRLLGCDIRYNQQVDAVVFEAKYLGLKINQRNIHVNARMQALANESMEALLTSNFSRVVSGLIRKHPKSNKESIAEKLHMSGRHLNRKLSAQATSFTLLRSRVRQQLAEAWLRDQIPVIEIAQELGFSDESSFSRAFKRWTGKKPTHLKRTNTEPPHTKLK